MTKWSDLKMYKEYKNTCKYTNENYSMWNRIQIYKVYSCCDINESYLINPYNLTRPRVCVCVLCTYYVHVRECVCVVCKLSLCVCMCMIYTNLHYHVCVCVCVVHLLCVYRALVLCVLCTCCVCVLYVSGPLARAYFRESGGLCFSGKCLRVCAHTPAKLEARYIQGTIPVVRVNKWLTYVNV